MPVRDGAAPAGARLLRRAPGTHAGLAKGPTTVYEPGDGGWKRWSTGRRPWVNYHGKRRYSVKARPFRWTYTLLEGERWRNSIGDSPRFPLQRWLERGTVEAV
jgi:hypothetical protein